MSYEKITLHHLIEVIGQHARPHPSSASSLWATSLGLTTAKSPSLS